MEAACRLLQAAAGCCRRFAAGAETEKQEMGFGREVGGTGVGGLLQQEIACSRLWQLQQPAAAGALQETGNRKWEETACSRKLPAGSLAAA